MAALTYFTVTADMLAVVGAAGTPSTVPIRGKVTFTPMIHSGDALVLTTLSPRPGLVSPQPVTGVIGSDGQLGFGGSVGVRLIADTPVLGLSSPLFYTVDFVGLTVNGQPRQLTSFEFQAAQSDTPINLANVARVPGQPASGVVNAFNPDHVRINGSGQLVFTAHGVDLPSPLDVVAALVTDNNDGTAALEASFGGSGGFEATANKGQLNGYAGLNGSGQLTQDTTGNAATATSAATAVSATTAASAATAGSATTAASAAKLTTPRNINGVAFDGTAPITVADATKEPTVTVGTTSQWWRGDKTFTAIASTNLSDSTAVGQALVGAASQAAGRAAIGAGTSSVASTDNADGTATIA